MPSAWKRKRHEANRQAQRPAEMRDPSKWSPQEWEERRPPHATAEQRGKPAGPDKGEGGAVIKRKGSPPSEYKFVIRDKKEAETKLRLLNTSDLTLAEKKKVVDVAAEFLGNDAPMVKRKREDLHEEARKGRKGKWAKK